MQRTHPHPAPRCRLPAVFLVAITVAVGACGGSSSNDFRGRGLSPASIPGESKAHVYEAAARAAFNLDDPRLYLLLDSRLLPRSEGYGDAPSMLEDVRRELRNRGIVKGNCPPPPTVTKQTLKCTADLPGYVVRFSDVLALGTDSVEVYLYAQKYDTPTSGASEALRFERVYQIVKRGGMWTATREGRLPTT